LIKDALQQALDTLIVLMNDESVSYDSWDKAKASETCATLNHALIKAELQAQQEPVAWMHEWEDGERIPHLYPRDKRKMDKPVSVRPLVYADIKTQDGRKHRTWAGLTDEEIAQGCKESCVTERAWQSAVCWAEAKLKEKNTWKQPLTR
jgi:hypothetical protein